MSIGVMAVVIVPCLIAVVMLLEAMSRADMYTEAFLKTKDGDYKLRHGVDMDDLKQGGGRRLLVKEKKFEVVEVSHYQCDICCLDC